MSYPLDPTSHVWLYCKSGSIAAYPHVNPTTVVLYIIYAIWARFSIGLIYKIVNIDLYRIFNWCPFLSVVFILSNNFLLLTVYRNNRVIAGYKLFGKLINKFKLCISVR